MYGFRQGLRLVNSGVGQLNCMAFYSVQNCKLCPELGDFVWITFSACLTDHTTPHVGRQKAAQDIVEHDTKRNTTVSNSRREEQQ
ncbi:Uncharacterized protein HZ326_8769 [Fusarium oxysporum f. sp. albedinis]|nr:Uncharacterized protein HZ326_8769 [Fusarium oxysporum f. sp. albedinis]